MEAYVVPPPPGRGGGGVGGPPEPGGEGGGGPSRRGLRPLHWAVSAKGSSTKVRQPPTSQHCCTSPSTTAPQRARKTSRPAPRGVKWVVTSRRQPLLGSGKA